MSDDEMDWNAAARGGGNYNYNNSTQQSNIDDIRDAGDYPYPNYEQDQESFRKFLLEHQILVQPAQRNDDDEYTDEEDDDDLLIPTHPGQSALVRRSCYSTHLQRIKSRHFYNSATATFVLEVPLDELLQWNAGTGSDLAERVVRNTARYVELFSRVVDNVLAGMNVTQDTIASAAAAAAGRTTSTSTLRDAADILQEQRLAQQQQQQQDAATRQQEQLVGANNAAVLHGRQGGLDDDPAARAAANAGTAANAAATQDFPPILMRRFELRMLPHGRRGTFPPFDRQQIPKQLQSQAGMISGASSLSSMGVSLRAIRANAMGQLVTVRGMVVRASDVKPACVVATYTCDACGAEIYQVVQHQAEFLPQRVCPVENCPRRPKSSETLHLQTRGSKFCKFQELKLQELPHQVPMGHIPRSLRVFCRGELTRLAAPGDEVTIDGIFLPQRLAETGYRAMKAGLISTTYMEAQNVLVHKKSYDESLMDTLTIEQSRALDADLDQIATSDDPVGQLSSLIAPEIFGHEDIKRALLLQLVGGCTRHLPDGMKIRGDINICIMGDPGTAKSQLLKHVASISPRGVYTTGKGSSGVGLTAAVTKDSVTGEMALEGGALVLADRGICCIDEFDKMDESDRTAIHEVMEQQTVSIAKAGILATLNARTAVLAAANPLYSRYNRRKSVSENVNLPNSLLSRFDLLFLVLDDADVDRDLALARHVTFVHQNEGLDHKKQSSDNSDDDNDDDLNEPHRIMAAPPTSNSVTTQSPTALVLREYIARARKHEPVVPTDVAPYIVEAYVSLRMQDRPGGGRRSGMGRRPLLLQQQQLSSKSSDQTVMTPRQLLSILRLCQALARLRFSDFVAREDVDEALRLTHMSKASLTDPQRGGAFGATAGGGGGLDLLPSAPRGADVMSAIYDILRDYANTTRSKELELRLCEAMVLRKGFTGQQLQSCLSEYEALQVLQVDQSRTHVYFVD